VCRSQINVYPERDTRGQNGMRYGQFASTHTPSPQKLNERASKTLICIAFHTRSQHTFRPTATSYQYTSWASLHPLDRGRLWPLDDETSTCVQQGAIVRMNGERP